MTRRTPKWRLNVRAAIILGVVLLVALPALVALSYYRGGRGPDALLQQAKLRAEADPPQYDLALGYVNEYLKAFPPSDPRTFEALGLKADILESVARSGEDLEEAARVDLEALRVAPQVRDPAPLAPGAPELQAIRRRLIGTYLKLVPFRGADTPLNVAKDIAEDLIEHDGQAPGPGPEQAAEDLRLLGRVLEYLAARGDNPKDRAEALEKFEEAYRRDPADLLGAEELATMYQFRLVASNPDDRERNRAKAEAVLDAMLERARAAEAEAEGAEAEAEAAATVAGAHLVRFRRLAALAAEEPSAPERRRLAGAAQEELDRALEKRPEDVAVLLAATENAVQLGDIEKARRYFDRIPAADRESLRGQLVRGLIDLGRNSPEQAIEAWRRGLEVSGGSDADLTWQLAYILIDLGRLDEAAPLLQQHRRLTGGDDPTPRHRFLQGLYHLKANEPDKALDELQKARFGIQDRFRGQVQMAIAQAYAMKGDLNSSMEQYGEAGKTRARWAAPVLGQVALLQQAGRLDEALDALDAALGDLPDDPALLVAKARALMILEQRKAEARRDYAAISALLERARAADPRSASLIRTDADLKVLQGDPNGAAEVLSQAVRRDPAAVELWLAWAGLLARLGQVDQAGIVLQQAAAPAAAGDRAALRVARARLLAATGKARQARDLLVADLDALTAADRALVWAELGNQLRQRGQFAEARDAYRKWAEAQPGDPKPRVALLELAQAAGDRQAVDAEIRALEGMGATGVVYANVAQAQELLRTPPGAPADARPSAEALAEADRIIGQLEADNNSRRAAELLRGLYFERTGRDAEAIDAYARALDAGAGQAAATRLAVLYSRTERFDDLETLRRRMAAGDLAAEAAGGTGGAFDRFSSVALLRAGRTEEAAAIAAQLVAGDPSSLDARLWQARVLNTAGKPEEAETALRELAEASTEPGPWLALLFFQIGRKEMDAARSTVDQIRQKVETEKPELLWAQCYRILGDNAAAEKALAAARAKAPDDPAVQRAQVALLEATGRVPQAVALLREVLAADAEGKARWAARTLALLRSGQAGGWDEAWSLAQRPEGVEDSPEEKLTRALVLSRSPDKARQDEALALFEELVENLPPTQPAAATARELLARAYLARNQLDKLAPLTAVGAASSNPQAIAIHGEVLLRDGKTAEARSQLERLLQLAPGDLATAKLRALVLKAEGKPAEAARGLLEAFDAHRTDLDGGRAAGREFLALLGAHSAEGAQRPPAIPDQLDVAAELGRKIAEAWPADAWLLGRILARQGQPAEAVAACRRAVEAPNVEPRDALEAAAVALALGVARDATDEVRDAADAVLQKARELAPEATEPIILQGFLRHAQQRYSEEVELYRLARERNAPSPLYLNNMAWTLALELGQPKEGLDIIDGLIAKISADPRFAAARLQCLDTRAMILLALDRPADALKDLQAAVAAQPDNAVYQYHLARAYLEAGQEDKFREHRELARKAGLTPEQLEPSEREPMQELMDR